MKNKGVISKISYEVDKKNRIVKVWHSMLDNTDYFEIPCRECRTEEDILDFIEQAYDTLDYGDDE